MKKNYQNVTVYDALISRLHFIFNEFDNILVSFSGGKDSGLLLNIVVDFKNKYYPDRTVGLFHQDFEAQYTATSEYVERTFERLKNDVEPYWVCLPMATRTAISNYEMYWYPWNDTERELWVRPMPCHDYVINLENNPFSYYSYRMHQEDLAKYFTRWYKDVHGGGKTVCLLGVRADESLNRYNGIVNKKFGYKGEQYLTRQVKDVWIASPMYDWSLSDVWYANYHFGYDYNHLYELYFKAGLPPEKMRVASPFNDYAKDSLNLYRVIDPAIWTKLVGRVKGVNFGAIYGRTKALGYRNLKLPEGHTWESYTKFLLDTLPPLTRQNYIKKFNTSIRFWRKTGGGLGEEVIKELIDNGYDVRRNGVSCYTLDLKYRVIFLGSIPDHTDDIRSSKDIPSWKRMCYCILKNDHNCRFMGFGLTRQQTKQIALLREKYQKVGEIQ